MVPDDWNDPPAAGDVVDAVERALGCVVTDVIQFEEGLNAVYRADRADGPPVVVKTATLLDDEQLLTEAALLSRLETETAVPLPAVHATLDPGTGPLDVAAYVTEYRRGRTVTDLLRLPPAARERLVVESGRHLGEIHAVRVSDGFGPLRIEDGSVIARPSHDSWRAWFEELAADALDRLRGEGVTTDSEPRFAALEPEISGALTARTSSGEWEADPAVLVGDYRPANLVLAPEDDADPIVRAVLDVGCGPAADGLLDLALAEDALVDVPLGGTDEADRLRERLRTAYRAARPVDPSAFDGDRYVRYRLYARTLRLASFDYWGQFAREDDEGKAADRCRSFVRDRIRELDPPGHR